MSIRARTITIVGGIAILATAALLVVSQIMVAGGFREQESQEVHEDLQRAQNTIDNNLRVLAASARDWAAWDETYAFMQGNNTDFYTANLADGTALTTLDVDLAVFVNGSGHIVRAATPDSTATIPGDLRHYVFPGSLLLQHVEALAGTTGLMALTRGPALFAAEPILHSDGTGTPAGSLLFVRYVDDAALAALERTTLTTISLAPLNGATLPADFEAARGALVTAGATFVSPLSDNEVAGYVRVSDAGGAPAYILRTVTNRDIYQRGQAVIGTYLTVELVGAIGIVLVVLLVLHRLVLAPLGDLRRAVGGLAAGSDPAARLPVSGDDELAALARAINSTLATVQDSRTEQQRLEERFALAFNATPAIQVISRAADHRILAVNEAFCHYSGYTAEEVVDRTLMELNLWPGAGADVATTAQLREQGRVSNLEITLPGKSGQPTTVLYSAQTIEFAGESCILSAALNITGRKDAEERVARQIGRLGALRTIDMAITASLDLRLTLTIVLEQVRAQLGVDAAALLLLQAPTSRLDYALGSGFRTHRVETAQVRLGRGPAGTAALERQRVTLAEASGGDPPFDAMLEAEGFVAYYAVPLVAKGQVNGVLEVYHRTALRPDHDWLDYLDALAGQAAIAVDNASLFADLQRSNTELALAYDTTLEGWSHALDLRDKETEGHTQRVTEITLQLGRAMGLDAASLRQMRRGALLHDIGKMGIPDGILLKPGPLTDEEWVIMRRHPQYAYELLAPISFLRPALDIPHYHHERWDGSGYPEGLRGDAIPLAARIFAVVDVWDALRSDRPYRAAWPEAEVRAYIRDGAGALFDPQVVAAFLALLPETIGAESPVKGLALAS